MPYLENCLRHIKLKYIKQLLFRQISKAICLDGFVKTCCWSLCSQTDNIIWIYLKSPTCLHRNMPDAVQFSDSE